MVLGFIAVKYIFRQLGEDALGIIYFTSIFNAILRGVLDKGIYSTTVREVSAHIDKEPEYIRDLIQTGSLFCWGIYLVFSIVIYFSAPLIVEKWINTTTIDSPTAIYILRILGIASLIAFPVSFYSSLISGLERMELNNIIDVSVSILHQFGIVVVLMLGGSLSHVVYWIAACYVLKVTGYLAVCRRFFSTAVFLPRYVHSVLVRNMKFASHMVSISVLAMLNKQADKVMISKLLPIGQLGYYGFAYGAVSKAGLITAAIAQAAFPSFCSLSEEKDGNRLITQYSKLQDLVCYMTLPLFALISFAALPLFTYIFNEEIAKALQLPVVLLSLGFYLNGTMSIPYRIILATGKPEIAVRQNLYAIFTVLPITLVSIYFFGLSGAAMGWVLYFLFCYAYSVPRICHECMGKPAWFFYGHVLKVFLLTVLTYGVAYGILVVVDIFTISSLSLAYVIASAIFLIGAYFMIGDDLGKTILRHIQSAGNKFNFRALSDLKWRNSKL